MVHPLPYEEIRDVRLHEPFVNRTVGHRVSGEAAAVQIVYHGVLASNARWRSRKDPNIS